jgi:hypothetical protein
MKIDSLDFCVPYFVFSLFDPTAIDWYADNMVTSDTMSQGFAWRFGQIEFYTLNPDNYFPIGNSGHEAYQISLDIMLNESIKFDSTAMRVIKLPFSVTGNDGIRISNYLESADDPPSKIDIPIGDYSLIFEQGWKHNPQPIEKHSVTGEDLPQILYTLWGRLWFNLEKNVEPKILLGDSVIVGVDFPLQMDGQPQ